MPWYFAYGSNLCSDRLRARVGHFDVGAVGYLRGWAHRFTKHGSDGTAKGNIEPYAGAHVRGALYRLWPEQLDSLDGFEGGYERARLDVHIGNAAVVPVVTYVAVRVSNDLRPTAEYLQWYRRGIVEHSIGEDYLAQILADAMPSTIVT